MLLFLCLFVLLFLQLPHYGIMGGPYGAKGGPGALPQGYMHNYPPYTHQDSFDDAAAATAAGGAPTEMYAGAAAAGTAPAGAAGAATAPQTPGVVLAPAATGAAGAAGAGVTGPQQHQQHAAAAPAGAAAAGQGVSTFYNPSLHVAGVAAANPYPAASASATAAAPPGFSGSSFQHPQLKVS